MVIKKMLALILASVMLLSVLAACNTQKPVETQPKETKPAETKPAETQPAETEDKSITFPLEQPLDITCMMVMGNTAYSYNDNIAWQHLQERANINIEIQEFPAAEATEKMNLLMSSGDYTDILFKCNYIDINQYGMDGILIPLEDLIREYAPNLCALLDERNGWSSITAPDGHVYATPNFKRTYSNTSGTCYWINRAWLDAVGMDMPTNNDELYEVLKAFKEKDPNGNGIADEIPWIVPEGSSVTGHLINLMCWMGEGLWYQGNWMLIDGQMTFAPTTEWFKENVLKFYAKLYAEGLINEDCYTLTQDQMKAVAKTGANIYGMWFASGTSYAPDEERLNWATLKPFNPENFALASGVSDRAFAITDKCENPEIMMAWIDYLYTQEGGKVIRMGIEDVSYKINPDGSYTTITEGFDSNTYQATLMGAATVPGVIPDLYYDGVNAEISPYSYNDNMELYKPGYGAMSEGVIVPALSYSTEEYETFNIYHTDIQTYVRNYMAECVTGLISIDDTWADFQDTLKQMHIEELVKIQQSAYERGANQ